MTELTDIPDVVNNRPLILQLDHDEALSLYHALSTYRKALDEQRVRRGRRHGADDMTAEDNRAKQLMVELRTQGVL